MTDARHGWRKNSKDTSVVSLGEKTHKVMDCVHVTKTRDPVIQRHERIRTETIWQKKMCQFKFMHMTEIFLLISL